jgi:hypothetical protein
MSPSTRPSRPPSPKRPWYLVMALVAAWISGALAMGEGCSQVQFYQGPRAPIDEVASDLKDADSRADVVAAAEKYSNALDAAKDRVLPLGVASILLGAAMVMLAASAMGGRAWARGALVQVVLVNFAVFVVGLLLTPDVTRVHIDLNLRDYLAHQREVLPDHATFEALRSMAQRMAAFAQPMAIALRAVGSGLLVLALALPKSRASFGATSTGSAGSTE